MSGSALSLKWRRHPIPSSGAPGRRSAWQWWSISGIAERSKLVPVEVAVDLELGVLIAIEVGLGAADGEVGAGQERADRLHQQRVGFEGIERRIPGVGQPPD